MIIRVTSCDIEHGEQRNGQRCPIALAANYAGLHGTVVDGEQIFHYDYRGNRLLPIPLPPVAQQFVKEFDDALPVNPFEFEVALIREAVPA